MKDQRVSKSRRELVKLASVAGAVYMPGKWAKPVVDSVLTPVHAITTDTRDNTDTIVCSSEEICYEVSGPFSGHFHGPIPEDGTIAFFDGGCSSHTVETSTITDGALVVNAPTQSAAAELLPCGTPTLLSTDPPLSGCTLWICD